MKFIGTRNASVSVSGPQAVVKGIAPDGGLFVPEALPSLGMNEIKALAQLDYPQRAALIIGKFLGELGGELGELTERAYSKFDGDPAPLVKIDEGKYSLELWHGPTHAFKDIALTLLPYLLTRSKKLLGETERTLILTATSGDTGKAALEGFCDVEGTDVMVFYPSEGVSELQKLQMMTQRGNNVSVKAIRGNFDDAQTAVKRVFTDPDAIERLARAGYAFGSANSINFGRLVPQIAYYFSAYVDLADGGEIKWGDKVNFCVPTGNFGNILAGWYARRMGLPVGKLICASNSNNVLTEFFGTGVYDANRKFYKTTSPSMDILVSSNLERLVFELSGRDAALTARRMDELKHNGRYEITAGERESLAADFYAGCASDDEVKGKIGEVFEDSGYLIDPHTAVAFSVYDGYRAATGDETPTVIVSTASPYKFASTVLDAIGESTEGSELDMLARLEDATALPLPESLSELPGLKKKYKDIINKEDVLACVCDYAESKRDGSRS